MVFDNRLQYDCQSVIILGYVGPAWDVFWFVSIRLKMFSHLLCGCSVLSPRLFEYMIIYEHSHPCFRTNNFTKLTYYQTKQNVVREMMFNLICPIKSSIFLFFCAAQPPNFNANGRHRTNVRTDGWKCIPIAAVSRSVTAKVHVKNDKISWYGIS